MLHYKWFADNGHAEAAKAVAHLLTHGVEQNLGAALEYLMQAAEMGDADAMAHIGHAYANGIAVAQSNATAKSWFVKAAEKGHPTGLFGLAVTHPNGQGLHLGHAAAARFFKQAIAVDREWAGRSDALFYAGTCFCLFSAGGRGRAWGVVLPREPVGPEIRFCSNAAVPEWLRGWT